ncbi:unnamed protein product, partial [Ectocarpus sp. 6 AP-2014]
MQRRHVRHTKTPASPPNTNSSSPSSQNLRETLRYFGNAKVSGWLVEGVSRAQEVVDHVRLVVQLLVHHQGQDAHLCRAPVVQLDRALRRLGLLRHRV